MIERQVRALYKKLQKKWVAAISSEEFYSDFMNLIQSGARTFTQHNVEVYKTIDETWVHAIEEALPHLSKIVNHPRSFIKSEESIMPVELARKITSNTIKNLAANTQFISRIDNQGMVIPSKILSSYNEESLDIYENRFVMTLLNKLFQFVDRRYYLIGEKAGNEFSSDLNIKGKFSNDDEKTAYDLKINIEQGPNYFRNNESPDLFIRLDQVRSYLNSFQSSQFVKVLSKLNPVRAPVAKTNLLMKNPDYQACYKLYNFIESYTKAGYSVEVIDSNPLPTKDFLDEANSIMLFFYLLLKNNMEIFQEIKEGEFRKKRTYDPKIVARYDTQIADADDVTDQKTLLMAVQLGQSRKVAEKIRMALLTALDKEDEKKEQRVKEDKEKEKQLLSIIRGAIASERGRAKNAEKETEIMDVLKRSLGSEEDKKKEVIREEKTKRYKRAIETAIDIEDNRPDEPETQEEQNNNEPVAQAGMNDMLDLDDLMNTPVASYTGDDEGEEEEERDLNYEDEQDSAADAGADGAEDGEQAETGGEAGNEDFIRSRLADWFSRKK